MDKKFENGDKLLYPAHSSTLDSCVLQGCVKGVLWVFQGCKTTVTRVLKGPTQAFQCKGVTKALQECYKGFVSVSLSVFQ